MLIGTGLLQCHNIVAIIAFMQFIRQKARLIL